MNHKCAKVDSAGFIDSTSFQDDIRSALDADQKYRETDYMKKRAVKVAKSYDEFRDMVACAHLKTVSRKEVEELSVQKKGWKKAGDHRKNHSLLDEGNNADTGIKFSASTLPKSMLEFGRDWRRLESDQERVRYLQNVGTSKFKKLVFLADDFELLEDLMQKLVSLANSPESPVVETNDGKKFSVVKWIKAVGTMRNYAMLEGCMDKSLLVSVNALLAEAENKPKKTKISSATVPGDQDEGEADLVPSVFEKVTAAAVESTPVVTYDATDELD